MKTFLEKFGKYIFTLIMGIVIGILINFLSFSSLKIEYIKIHNKHEINKERIVEKTKIVNSIDTFIKVDSIYLEKDGTYVLLPFEHKVYNDTLKTDSSYVDITINYSGINSSIDSYNLDFIYDLKQITNVQSSKKFGFDLTFGLYVGYGISGTVSNPMTFGHGPEIGIGFCIGPSYRISK